MKKSTGEFAWIRVTDEQFAKVWEACGHMPYFGHAKDQAHFLCKEMKDIQTGTLTWEPLRAYDGKIEL